MKEKQLVYDITMATNTFVTALGMHWENKAREQRGESPAYGEEHFKDLIEENGTHHNRVVFDWLDL